MTDHELMSIGEFSRLSRLSVRMLRHYDAQGVLVPAAVNPRSGYRQYAPGQLVTAAEIRRLRDVGIGVAGIAALLAQQGTAAYGQALLAHRAALAQEQHRIQHRLDLLDRLINTTKEIPMPITITRTSLPARTLVTLRGVIPTYSDEGQLWGRFLPLLTEQGIVSTGPGGVLEHDEEYRESEVDESVWLPVANGTRATEPLEVVELPEQDIVMATVVGPYGLISEAHARIADYLTAEGLVPRGGGLAGKVFNRYLTDPSQTPEDQNVTEVCLPVTTARA
ncbi:MAG: MerR family transcriptional regulator [Propionibacteriaceae bacterium]|nr:MerR family transcriptional regulator [Propionibacteriaceae bacterium]